MNADQSPILENPPLHVHRTPVSRRRLGVVAAVGAVVVVGVIVWLVVRGGSSTTSPPKHKTIAAVSESGLATLAATLRGPIYWLGPRTGVSYEVTQLPDGKLYVRYLPHGVKIGSPRPYPFAATLPFANAFARTSSVAYRRGAVRIPIAPNAIAFYNRALPTNAWIAYRGSNYQIELYDPDPERMRRVIAEDRVQPVLPTAPGALTASSVTAASLATLDSLPGDLGHPVYWEGAQSGVKYELTLTPTGGVFVRYLPSTAKIGANVRYPFVASLPVASAFAATSRVAAKPTSVRVPVPGGGVAFYGRSLPTNVYVAFPGSNYQIELFDPNPAHARAVVSSGLVRPLP
jgi:hypothetical protein